MAIKTGIPMGSSCALHVVRAMLGDNFVQVVQGTYKGRYLTRIAHVRDYSMAVAEKHLRRELDAINWQFVTTGESAAIAGSESPMFGIAPISEKTVSVAYHATPLRVIDLALQQGLLPSNGERSATGFPDTEGTIHVCQKLTGPEGEKDSAEWWMKHLSTKNRFYDPCWGILRIDMARLTNARVYEDMHSQSGLIVDRIELIPKELMTVVPDMTTS